MLNNAEPSAWQGEIRMEWRNEIDSINTYVALAETLIEFRKNFIPHKTYANKLLIVFSVSSKAGKQDRNRKVTAVLPFNSIRAQSELVRRTLIALNHMLHGGRRVDYVEKRNFIKIKEPNNAGSYEYS